MDQDAVIAVNLDGTLTPVDTLHESIIKLLSTNFLCIFIVPFWLLGGKAAFKARIAGRIRFDARSLPYNQPLIGWLDEQRSAGRRLALCTAADRRTADAIAEHLRLFDHVLASDGTMNLSGHRKRLMLEERFGSEGFDYAGNALPDLEIWSAARRAILVNAPPDVTRRAGQIAEVERIFPAEPIRPAVWFRIFRVHQWTKNLLLLVPVLAAHHVGDARAGAVLALAFLSLCFVASAVYIVNDLVDLESDRRHPRKRYRPFASAVVPVRLGVVLAPLGLAAGLLLALLVSPTFFAWLLVYFALTSAYSLRLKRIVLVDCLTLAGLYTLRIVAGAAAGGVELSVWLLAFSIFIFLSLAFVKRYAELRIQGAAGNSDAHGRGYLVSDAPLIQTLGISAGYAAVTVLALYLNGETAAMLYRTPEIIWGAIPLVLFWVNWVWLKAHRGQMHDDPIVFAIRDKASRLVMFGIVIAFALATNVHFR